MAKAKVKYVAPNGEFVPGIPARDMTAAEWEAIDPEIRKDLVDHGLYQVQGKSKEVKDG